MEELGRFLAAEFHIVAAASADAHSELGFEATGPAGAHRMAVDTSKLCAGAETRHPIPGLKAFPWDARHQKLWKS
ncbi:MAG TPA: hypothetical protein VFD49_05365 [Candidatus Dormibacteraeota bacterium]|nr:hypothetical protein [Candidatus Dormibacteraeota bacterium]